MSKFKVTNQQSRIIADIVMHYLEKMKMLGKLERLVSEDRDTNALMVLSKEILECNNLPKSYLLKEENAYKVWLRTGNAQSGGWLVLR